MKIDKASFEGISQTTPLQTVAGAAKNVEARMYGFRVELNPLPLGTLQATTDLGTFDVIPGHFYEFVDPLILHSITDSMAESIRLTVLSGKIIPVGAGGGGGGGVPSPAFSFIDFPGGPATETYTVPAGVVMIRFDLTGAGTPFTSKYQAKWVLNNDPLIFYDEQGNGYYTADTTISKVWYLEVNPINQRVAPGQIIFTQVDPTAGGTDVTLTPSFTPRMNEIRSLTWGYYDAPLGIVPGVSDAFGDTWLTSLPLPAAGAKSWCWQFHLACTGAQITVAAVGAGSIAVPAADAGQSDDILSPMAIIGAGDFYFTARRTAGENNNGFWAIAGSASTPASGTFNYPGMTLPSEFLQLFSAAEGGAVNTIADMNFTINF